MTADTILRIAIPSALPGCFDYLAPADAPAGALLPGARVAVRLGRQARVGVIAEVLRETPVPRDRLKPIERVIDESPVVPADLFELLEWVARYYHQPLGRVLQTALPLLARRGAPPQIPQTVFWECAADAGEVPVRAKKQRALFNLLEDSGRLNEAALHRHFPGWRPVMRRLAQRGFVVRLEEPVVAAPPKHPGHPLNHEQQQAVAAVAAGFGGFQRHLLEGITGSGKTEVYLALCEQVMERGGQALVLVPEIALTSQTVERFRERLQGPVGVFHSGLTDRERFHCWSAAHSGGAGVVIGTRSAVFLPFRRLGLVVVDEEHDASYKQSESSFRYHARDVAIKRAQIGALPVVLGSATPSLESLRNTVDGRYAHARLTRRAAGASPPRWKVIDLRGSRLEDGLSPVLLAAMRERLAAREQVLLFLNRRGYAPVMLCRDCGAALSCTRCDARLVYHLHDGLLRCHHCGVSMRPPETCRDCGTGDLRLVGLGTEKVEEHLTRLFPDTGIVRIDTDAVRRKNELERRLDMVRSGGAGIVLGTQMLTKGHHFPAMTLVGIINVDQSLFAADFRAMERLGQLIVQVGGRAGRSEAAGEVMLQTHHPEHPQLQVLLNHGYAAFASQLLAQREAAHLPPYRHLAVIRARAAASAEAAAFLDDVYRDSQAFATRHATQVYMPVPMMMEKKAGHYRAQLLLSAASAVSLNACLAALLPAAGQLARRRKVKWHVDVDPYEIA